MKFFLLSISIIFLLSAALYTWHLHMNATWDHHIAAKPHYFRIKDFNSELGERSFSLAFADDVPEIFRNPLEIRKIGPAYYWINNDNIQLIRSVESEPRFNRGERRVRDTEYLVFKNLENNIEIRIRTTDYEFSGCERKHKYWTGNLIIREVEGSGKIIESRAYFDIYENPYQYFFCWLHPAPQP